MKTDFTIREAQQTDTIALKELFQNTVLAVNSKDYSQAEVEDWASCGDDLSNIEEMIKTHYFIVAVNQQSQIVGFSSITSQGYLHSMFVHKDFQGKGIATMLLEEIERYAITADGCCVVHPACRQGSVPVVAFRHPWHLSASAARRRISAGCSASTAALHGWIS